jgi:hypothetical protein
VQNDKISRKTSALNKYIFDDIKEVEDQQEEEDSSKFEGSKES